LVDELREDSCRRISSSRDSCDDLVAFGDDVADDILTTVNYLSGFA
jgi:hypothetical protein